MATDGQVPGVCLFVRHHRLIWDTPHEACCGQTWAKLNFPRFQGRNEVDLHCSSSCYDVFSFMFAVRCCILAAVSGKVDPGMRPVGNVNHVFRHFSPLSRSIQAPHRPMEPRA